MMDLATERNHIQSIENQIKKEPDICDLRKSLRVLKDFGVKMTLDKIPHFCSVAELERWQRKQINNFLDSCGEC